MAALRPAYLIHGDDHGRIAERRAGLRALAEREGGAAGLEVFEGESSNPAAVAAALSAMTFAIGRRVLIVDGVERWKAAEIPPLAEALSAIAPDTTAAFFGREEGRATVPEALAKAVEAAGGQVVRESTLKPWELPKWAAAQAAAMGLELDAGAARAIVARAAERQQRILRELERLLVERGPGPVTLQDAEEVGADERERRAFDLADALLARDSRAAAQLQLRLAAQGERVGGLTYWAARRIREGLEIRARLDAGESESQARRSLRMPPKAAERLVRDVARTDRDALRRALGAVADLEVATRGGSELSEETAALRAMLRITA